MRLLVSVLMALVVSGCALPTQDMEDNRFVEIRPEPTSAPLVGIWTGSNGPYLLTLKIEPDGTGLYCASWNERHTLAKIKMADGKVHYQDGTKMRLSREGDTMVGKYDYVGANSVRFVADPSLSEASPYCAENL